MKHLEQTFSFGMFRDVLGCFRKHTAANVAIRPCVCSDCNLWMSVMSDMINDHEYPNGSANLEEDHRTMETV